MLRKSDPASPALRFGSCGGATHAGHLRPDNEDAWRANAQAGVLIVADGIGGHPGGEIASAVASDSAEAALLETPPATAAQALVGADAAVYKAALADGAGPPGMGCTLVLCRLARGCLDIAWAGDSRLYLLRDGELRQLTHDHTYVQGLVDGGFISAHQALHHPRRNMLSRYIGGGALQRHAQSSTTVAVLPGDRVLGCTDGLTNEFADERIAALLAAMADDQAAAAALIEAALAAGGRDNVTAVVATVAV